MTIINLVYEAPSGWTPGANTIGYRPLQSDLKDYSGNGYDFETYSGTTSFVDNMVKTNGKIVRNNLINSLGNSFTLSMYIVPSSTSNSESYLFASSDRSTARTSFGYGFGNFKFDWYNGSWGGAYYNMALDGNPHLVTATKDGTTVKIYVDGALKATATVSQSLPSLQYMTLGNVGNNSLTISYGRLIMENKVWTAQEVADYYNQTKSQYGIS